MTSTLMKMRLFQQENDGEKPANGGMRTYGAIRALSQMGDSSRRKASKGVCPMLVVEAVLPTPPLRSPIAIVLIPFFL